jgi:DNA-binding MarR family transcriptional regulator
LAEAGIEINPLQFGILHSLHQRPRTLSELSKVFVLDPSTLVPVVDRLEEKQLIERSRDPNDRRRTPLVITPAGVNFMTHCEQFHENVLANSVETMGVENARQLLALLRQLMHGLPEGESLLTELHQHLYQREHDTAQAPLNRAATDESS